MKTYNQTSIPSSSEELARAIQEIHDLQSLWDVSKLAARGVHFCRIPMHEAWDALLIRSIVAGLGMLEAQECIGRAFAMIRFEEAVAS